MKVLILGATGATGRLLVEQLLERGHRVKVVVRLAARLPESIRDNPSVEITEGNVLTMTPDQLTEIVKDCDAAASCLGHNITIKGIFGPPRRLVTDSVRRVCAAITAIRPERTVKFALMNTTGNRNRDLDERLSLGDRLVIGLMRWLVPPQADNEQAAEYFRKVVGQNDGHIQWAAVRPETLIDRDKVSPYKAFPSPITSPVFGKGQTSRINVAHFMAELLSDRELWGQWKGKMPVIYNER